MTQKSARILLGALVVMLVVVGTAIAGPIEDANTARQRGDYAAAMRILRPLAEQGNAFARALLGGMYYNGQGVPQSYAEAARWYRLAADQGLSVAQFGLGGLYYNGQGEPQNYTEALKWYRLAADQGNADAQNNLGIMYANGRGVPQNFVQAYMWLSLLVFAPDGGGPKAAQARDILAAKMTPAQIAEAQKLAAEWKPKQNVAQQPVGMIQIIGVEDFLKLPEDLQSVHVGGILEGMAFTAYGYGHSDYPDWVNCAQRKTLGDTTSNVVEFIKQTPTFKEGVSSVVAQTLGRRCAH
jgi:uncharacterized protein